MKLVTPENSALLDVASVEPHPDGIMIHGKIMGAMPMKAVLRPEEFRRGFRFMSLRLTFRMIHMLFQRPRR